MTSHHLDPRDDLARGPDGPQVAAVEIVEAFDYDGLAPDDAAIVLACREEIRQAVAQGIESIVAIGRQLLRAKASLKHGQFLVWIATEFDWSRSTAQNYMNVAERIGGKFPTVGNLPSSALYALSADSVSDKVRKRVLALSANGQRVTAGDVADAAADDDGGDRDPVMPEPIAAALDLAEHPGKFSLAEWKRLNAATRQLLIEEAPAYGGTRRQFTPTNDNVDWARWTWNPVTGCLHDCPYCYARDIAARFYDQGFAPTFIPERLHAPRYTPLPSIDPADPIQQRRRNVFVGSMADLFGKWVPQEWIDAVFAEVLRAPDWRFLFLTKFPRKLAEQDWPDNAWVGTSVDTQRRVEVAEKSFRDVRAGVKWLSCEPMLERLTFTSLEMFDWVVIGGESPNSHNRAGFDPPWEWIEHLYRQARDAGCRVYFKENLRNRPKELPTMLEAP